MIKELSVEHEVIITCRPLANTIDLLDLHGFKYHIIGKHYGKKILYKIFGYPIRVYQLYKFLRKNKPDIAVAQSSFHSPVAASLLGIPSIYMNDNEHAMGNIPSFIFASKILIPEFLSVDKVKKQFASKRKIIQYPGVKEGIYLWNTQIPESRSLKAVYIRPEPWTAQYYKGALNFMDEIILEMKKTERIILLPRGKDQAIHYEKAVFEGIQVQNKPLSLVQIASNCKLFIGAGGTMTREMAVLGIPTISVYQDKLLEVDEYLIKTGMMIHKQKLTAQEALDYLIKNKKQPSNPVLLGKGKDSYQLIKSLILNKNL
jgi:hypothetical protein